MNVVRMLRCVAVLVLGCFLQLVAGQLEGVNTVSMPTRWKQVLNFINDQADPVSITVTMINGFKTLHRDQLTLRTSDQVNFGVAVDDAFQVLNAQATVVEAYGDDNSQKSSWLSMSQADIYASKDKVVAATVQPGVRCTMWQLVGNAAGEDIGFNHVIQAADPNEKHEIRNANVTLLVMKQILPGITPFRIKHKATGLFMTIVSRKGWPAATLTENSGYYFVLGDEINGGHRIITLNSTSPGYTAMYSSSSGGIYFDKTSSGTEQTWIISKPPPFNFGSTVSFKNGYWSTAGLTNYDGPATKVYCLEGKFDAWSFV